MAFKVGDTVKVRHDLREDRRYNNVSVCRNMVDDFAGAVVTIQGLERYGKYSIK